MADFDPELYLRLLGERDLAVAALGAEPGRGEEARGLPDAAAALSVTGVIDTALAAEIAAAYREASMMHQPHNRRFRQLWRQAPTAAPVTPLTPRRVYRLEATVPVRDGEMSVRALTLTGEEARLEAEVRWHPQATAGGAPHPPAIQLGTPDGQRHSAHFAGGWSDEGASGTFVVGAELGADLEWIEVESARIPLPAPAPAPVVEIETFPAEGRAVRYLWQLLADFGARRAHGDRLSGAAAALVAAGVIDAADPRLEAVFQVAEQRGAVPRPQHLRAGLRAGPRPAAGPPSPAIPEEWRALLAGHRAPTGPTGSIAIGAATPVFDGISVAVNALNCAPAGFTLSVETAGVPHAHPMFGGSESKTVAWWARDDRGGAYLGEMNNWSGGTDHSTGTLGFGPLNPQATELTLAVTALDARALIRVPLEWGG